MRMLFEAMGRHAAQAGDAIAFSDSQGVLSRSELVARVGALAAALRTAPRTIGLLAPNGIDWAVAQLACALAGKIVVPLPTFFSPTQLGHIVRNASVELVLTIGETQPLALQFGIDTLLVGTGRASGGLPDLADGFGQVIYTSGSTGQPKGVRHESGQIAWSSRALAAATGATASDRYLSVLPLSLLLETICSIFSPVLLGARVHFETQLADAVGRGDASGIAKAFNVHQPTMSVIVPQLLKQWVGELRRAGHVAPAALRFVAVGGASVPTDVAAAAWKAGIPAYEGYGLSECCSVVSVNRAGATREGTVGRPLIGLDVTIDQGEIVVDGPSVTDGYLGQGPAMRPWRTGDLGAIDHDGFLTVYGRKDSLIVTSFGRNVSPEWIETMLLGDPRIALGVVVGHGQPHLTALLVPSRQGAVWFAGATDSDIQSLVATCCSAAPGYALPAACIVVSPEEAMKNQLIANGRPSRRQIEKFVAARSAAANAAARRPSPLNHKDPQHEFLRTVDR
jgi:long-subunit acyl-CoA synthetase (AMP-forming)